MPPNDDQIPRDVLCQHIVADRTATRRTLQAGASVGLVDASGDFTIVVDGALALTLLRRDGRRTALEVLGPGSCIPPTMPAGIPPRALEITALVPSVVARVPMPAFDRIVQGAPHLTPLVGAKMAEHYQELVGRIAVLAERSPTRRLAASLAYLARRIGRACPLAPGRRVLLSQQRLAEVADLARQTTNRSLRHLQRGGLLRLERGMVCILDLPGLDAVAHGAPLPRGGAAPGPCRLMHPEAPLSCYPLRRRLTDNN